MNVTKVYTVADPAGRTCSTKIAEMDHGEWWHIPCTKLAVWALDIDTTAISGRYVLSRVSFCMMHIPARYRHWFKLTKDNYATMHTM